MPARPPARLAIYYGYPSIVNGANGDTTLATQAFKDYDLVVLGDGIELPTHSDHARTQTIITNLKTLGTQVFGYVDICVSGGSTCTNLALIDIESRADQWQAMGVAGIFLDQAGYDYTVSRERLNSIVDYLHGKNLSAFVNAWVPDDVFSPKVNATLNPNGTATHLGPKDWALHESFAVELSAYQSPDTLITKSDSELAWKNQLGTHIATVNTLAQGSGFDAAQFAYCWWMSLVYGFDAMAWGETWVYSADTNALAFHARPNLGDLGSSVVPLTVMHQGSLQLRHTTSGKIQVDTSSHMGTYMPGL
jgi:hypothetical protein